MGPGPVGEPPPVPLQPEVIPLATLKYWDDWYKDRILKDDEVPARVVGSGEGIDVLEGAASANHDNNDDDDDDDDDEVFEWLAGTGVEGGGALWRRLMSLPRDSRVLELGCGVSLIAERMAAEEGFTVQACDFSHIPIDIMRRRAKERNIPPDRLRYDVADVLTLDETFPAQSFDVVVDKGLLDVLLNAHDQVELWRRGREDEEEEDDDNVSEDEGGDGSERRGQQRAGGKEKKKKKRAAGVTTRPRPRPTCGYDGESSKRDAHLALSHVYRVLRPGGVFIMLSYEPPRGRTPFLMTDDERYGWTFQTPPAEDERGNFLYVLSKKIVEEEEEEEDEQEQEERRRVDDAEEMDHSGKGKTEDVSSMGGGEKGGGGGIIIHTYDPDELD